VSAEHYDLRAIAPQAWKNGAGRTREIAYGGDDRAHFDWRISVAEVERDAPFSIYTGIDRCIVLLRGRGMLLRSHDGSLHHRLDQPYAPLRFPGDTALDAMLIDGACTDLNAMTRRGTCRSEVTCHHAAFDAAGGGVVLLLCCDGEWQLDGADDARPLTPQTALLWRAPAPAVSARPMRASGRAAMIQVRLCHESGA
jgi:uncharacterized protein